MAVLSSTPYAQFIGWLKPDLSLDKHWHTHLFTLSPVWQCSIALMLNILSLALPIMMLQIYDRIIPREAFSTLIMLVIGVLTALILDATLRLLRAWLNGWAAANHEHIAGCAAMERFTKVDMKIYEASSAGTHMQRLNALSRLREFYSGQTLTALVDMPFALLFLALIAYLGGWLVCVPLILLAVFFVFARQAGFYLKNALEHRTKADDRKSGFMISLLSGMHTVKAHGFETQAQIRFENQQSHVTQNSYHVALASGFAGMLGASFAQASLILTAAFGSILVVNGHLSVGGLSACTILAGRALQPVQRVLGTWLRLQDFNIAKEQSETLLTMPVQKKISRPQTQMLNDIKLHNITFSFEENAPLFKHISLNVAPGEVVAISGEKGCGKSVLLQLIAGTLTPEHGKILIGDINPAEISLCEVKDTIGYLPQQGVIYKGTILENLSGFAKDEASIKKAKQAAAELGLDKAIDLLPKGYATMLSGTEADPLPPGIRQRIALARILKHRPAILLFDDADRALDKEGYNRLFKTMGKLKGHCTMVMVSHDQNLLSFADRHYKLENGALTQVDASDAQYLSLLMQTPQGSA